eukprot:10244758-Alexandrium_andersonii.AAC.1
MSVSRGLQPSFLRAFSPGQKGLQPIRGPLAHPRGLQPNLIPWALSPASGPGACDMLLPFCEKGYNIKLWLARGVRPPPPLSHALASRRRSGGG